MTQDTEQEDYDHWFECEQEIGNGSVEGVAYILEAVAQTIREGPEDNRYDVTLEVQER